MKRVLTLMAISLAIGLTGCSDEQSEQSEIRLKSCLNTGASLFVCKCGLEMLERKYTERELQTKDPSLSQSIMRDAGAFGKECREASQTDLGKSLGLDK